MAHHKIRKDTTCLNCGTEVHDRFCPHCGQENIETRHPFHYLFGHFVEDLTHYDSGFWKTIKYLLFRPGKLTNEYLAGKRSSYVPPVKLYIFISFITFFLMTVFSSSHHIHIGEKENTKDSVELEKSAANFERMSHDTTLYNNADRKDFAEAAKEIRQSKKSDSNTSTITRKLSQKLAEKTGKKIDNDDITILNGGNQYNDAKTVEELDSIRNALPRSERYNIVHWLNYVFKRKFLYLYEEGYTNRQILEKFGETIFHNIPKAIFFYMPFFAFWLWLFHNKKKWYYFDHGIFSLHYFSFLLVTVTILFLITILLHLIPSTIAEGLIGFLIYAFLIGYSFFYFFRAHSRIYKEHKAISRLKGVALFVINLVFMLIFLTGFVAITFYALD